jgi:hypothetical protein
MKSLREIALAGFVSSINPPAASGTPSPPLAASQTKYSELGIKTELAINNATIPRLL